MSRESILAEIEKVLAFQDARDPTSKTKEDDPASFLISHSWLSYRDLRIIHAAIADPGFREVHEHIKDGIAELRDAGVNVPMPLFKAAQKMSHLGGN